MLIEEGLRLVMLTMGSPFYGFSISLSGFASLMCILSNGLIPNYCLFDLHWWLSSIRCDSLHMDKEIAGMLGTNWRPRQLNQNECLLIT